MIPQFTQDPSDVLDYTFDWAAWLSSDTIAQSEWSSSVTDIQIFTETNTTTTATGWVGGGNVGDRALISNKITTTGGRTVERSFTLRIKNQ